MKREEEGEEKKRGEGGGDNTLLMIRPTNKEELPNLFRSQVIYPFWYVNVLKK